MAEPSFAIDADARAQFLKLTLVGDWDAAITARFAAEVMATLRGMMSGGMAHGQLRTLLDMRRKGVVPQVVANEFARILHKDSPSRRVAILASGALHRLQVKRLMDDRCALFDTEEEARAWLFAD
ncbi:hypothetical protein [Sphingomonas endophytica]|uniref:STAS/SEC14 domain-containing protein n=1 Tax=Sphingomonas endophytica TaxID=869719 RepID=A0A147I6L3_9SPHN|nr:hypothetical protein [Sphingomonas endophytica]KTT74605.1 hypothetical protein NS334_04215 [Sphingomonas endophytica]